MSASVWYAQLSWLVNYFAKFWRTTRDVIPDSADGLPTIATPSPCFCDVKAWYVDGEHETLEMCQLKTLSGNFAWRKQLAALQGYVVPQHVEYGLYRASEDVNNVQSRV